MREKLLKKQAKDRTLQQRLQEEQKRKKKEKIQSVS